MSLCVSMCGPVFACGFICLSTCRRKTWNLRELGQPFLIQFVRSFISCSECARLQSVSTVVFLPHHRWRKEQLCTAQNVKVEESIRGKGTVLHYTLSKWHPVTIDFNKAAPHTMTSERQFVFQTGGECREWETLIVQISLITHSRHKHLVFLIIPQGETSGLFTHIRK